MKSSDLYNSLYLKLNPCLYGREVREGVASSWLTWLERRLGACVVRNLTISSPGLPVSFYQYHLHCSVSSNFVALIFNMNF